MDTYGGGVDAGGSDEGEFGAGDSGSGARAGAEEYVLRADSQVNLSTGGR